MSVQALPPGAGRRFGSGITVKVDTGQSSDFMVMESELPPRWAGPPPHVHQAYDEAFYVLDGSVMFAVDGVSRDWPAGSFVFVPRGTVHGFANPGPGAVRVLVVATPGALQLVEGIYELMDEHESVDVDQMLALYARHHSEIVAPTAPKLPARARPRSVTSTKRDVAAPPSRLGVLPNRGTHAQD